MREIPFRSALVCVFEDHIESRFHEDGSVSRFYPPIGKPEFEQASLYAGYTCSMRFGLAHDILHHALAEWLGWPRSYVVWWDAHGQPDEPGTQAWRDLEEHIVIRLQRYIHTGEKDDDFGVLDGHFGASLPSVADRALHLVCPWLGDVRD